MKEKIKENREAHIHNGYIQYKCPNCGHINNHLELISFGPLFDKCEKCDWVISLIVRARENL